MFSHSGWVQVVYCYVLSDAKCIFKSKIRPSQTLNAQVHEAWTVIDKSGNIITGHCTCMAG